MSEADALGIILVDHGSREPASNRSHEALAAAFAEKFADRYRIVEPAHMELAEPTVAAAYARCVARGARHIIIAPCFLGPGRHSTIDIPRLAGQAAAGHPGTTWHVTAALGVDGLLLELLEKRIREPAR